MYPLAQSPHMSVPEYVQQMKESLWEAYATVRQNCQSGHCRQKAIYDKRVHGKPLANGDLVWLFTPAVPKGQSRKLRHPLIGPYKIVDRIGEATYKIRSPNGAWYTPNCAF